MMLIKYLKIQAGIQSVEQSNTDKKGIYDTLMQYKSTIINTIIGGALVGVSVLSYWMGNKNQDKTTCNNKQHHSLSDDLKGKQEEVDQLKSKEEKLQEQIKDLQTKLEKQIKSNKSPLDTTAESKNEEIEELKAELYKSNEKIKELETKLHEQSDIHQSNEKHKKKIEYLQLQVEVNKKRIEYLEQEYEDEIVTLTNEIEELKEPIHVEDCSVFSLSQSESEMEEINPSTTHSKKVPTKSTNI